MHACGGGDDNDDDDDDGQILRQKLALLSKNVIFMEEILGYMQESCDTTQIPPEPPEQAGSFGNCFFFIS